MQERKANQRPRSHPVFYWVPGQLEYLEGSNFDCAPNESSDGFGHPSVSQIRIRHISVLELLHSNTLCDQQPSGSILHFCVRHVEIFKEVVDFSPCKSSTEIISGTAEKKYWGVYIAHCHSRFETGLFLKLLQTAHCPMTTTSLFSVAGCFVWTEIQTFENLALLQEHTS